MTLMIFQKAQNRLGVNESLRPNMTLKAILNNIKPGLLPKDLLKRMALIIKRHFHLS